MKTLPRTFLTLALLAAATVHADPGGPRPREPLLPGEPTLATPGAWDAYGGAWAGQASWSTPSGRSVHFAARLTITAPAAGNLVAEYVAELPLEDANAPGGAYSARWSGTFSAPVGVNVAPGTPLSLSCAEYVLRVLETHEANGPFPARLDLTLHGNRLSARLGNDAIGFASIEMRRQSSEPSSPALPQATYPQFPSPHVPMPSGPTPREPFSQVPPPPVPGSQIPGPNVGPGTQGPTLALAGDWSGRAQDVTPDGRPLVYPVRLRISEGPNGSVTALYHAETSLHDPSSGRTLSLRLEETFHGSLQNDTLTLTHPNCRLLDARTGNVLATYPLTLQFRTNPRGLVGRGGNPEVGFSEIHLQRPGSTGSGSPNQVGTQGAFGGPQGGAYPQGGRGSNPQLGAYQ